MLTLRQWRLAKEISQELIAEKLGITRQSYQNWETDPSKISIKNAQLIAEILGVPIDDIKFCAAKQEGN